MLHARSSLCALTSLSLVASSLAKKVEEAGFDWQHHGNGDIILDTRIRDWVLIPIFIIMIFFTMLRELAGKMMNATSTPEIKAFKETQALTRSQLVRSHCYWLTESSFMRRKAFYTDKDRGVFSDPNVTKSEKDPLAMMSDPSMMMQQQKSMFTVMLPQMVMMGLISYFFSGFVMVKIPLPLSLKFKAMTQRGIELSSLDVTYVSSFSWYVLVSVGISGVMSLIMGKPSQINDAAEMERQMKMGQVPGQLDTPKLYQQEMEALNMIEHKFIVEEAEDRLIEMYAKKK
uniref:ER membrane protein complex subunit 3 n=2 Tax=Guillardia theta TaxID=55529 RepID=A0A7S4U5V7_GUITH|mmetsp:Transcript_40669/g.128227  ORF Transcript_40669/g.128227 Transcript_40669/m.128227 type:complete len:287 (+) Transcript_40669:56-916(+)